MAYYRCGNSTEVTPKITGTFGTTNNSMTLVRGNILFGFYDNRFYYPLTNDGAGNVPVYDTSKPFHIHLSANISNLQGSQTVLGNGDVRQSMPCIEFESDVLLAAGFSTNGTSWAAWVTVPFSEVPFSASAWYSIDYEWNGTTFTFTVSDGTHTSVKTATVGRHYQPPSGRRMRLGGSPNFGTAYYLAVDLANCYYEQDGVIIWGNKA